MKSLDIKLKNIISSNYKASDFIIADAKDADMAAGIRAPGYLRESIGTLTNKTANYEHYLRKMESMTASEEVDIMLMSMTSAERLINKKIFENNSVTPAIRLNDTSCTWGMIRNGEYSKEESRPFATAQLKHAKNFLQDGAKVKAFVFFRGRTIIFKEQGQILLLRLAQALEDVLAELALVLAGRVALLVRRRRHQQRVHPLRPLQRLLHAL